MSKQDTGATFVKKLSAKTIVGRIDVPEKATPLFRVYGQVDGVKSGTGMHGVWNAFLGAFEAVRLDTGEVFQGTQCFLPNQLTDLLVSQVNRLGETGSVEFAVEVGVKPSDSPIGYEYTVKNLIKPTGGDPLAALRDKVQTLALAAPAR